MLFEFLSEQEQQFFLQQEVDEIEECKKMIKFCDLQILKFMKKIKELEQKAGGLVVSGVSKKKKTEGLHTQEEITTNTVAVHELILRYNNEIEKAKKTKNEMFRSAFEIWRNTEQTTNRTNNSSKYLFTQQ